MKGLMTVEDAALRAYNEMSDEFSGLDLVRKAREFCGRPLAYEDTFFRSLRKLRAANKINYECTNHTNSFYRKVPKYVDRAQLSLFEEFAHHDNRF